MPATSTLVQLEKTEVYSTPPHLIHGLSLRLNQNKHPASFLTPHYRKGPCAGSQGTPFRIQLSALPLVVRVTLGTSSLCAPLPPLSLENKKYSLSCLPFTKELPDTSRIQVIMIIYQYCRPKSMMFRQINLKKSLTRAQREL